MNRYEDYSNSFYPRKSSYNKRPRASTENEEIEAPVRLENSLESQNSRLLIDSKNGLSSNLDEQDEINFENSERLEITLAEDSGIINSNIDEETTKSESETYSVTHTVIFIFLIMTLFLIAKILGKGLTLHHAYGTEEYEKKAFFALLKDLTFMVSIILTVLIIHYYEGLSSFNTSIDSVLYGMFFFILSWMLFGILIMKNSFSLVKRFKKWEKTS